MSDKNKALEDLLTLIEECNVKIKKLNKDLDTERHILTAIEGRITELSEIIQSLNAGARIVSLEEFGLIKKDLDHMQKLKTNNANNTITIIKSIDLLKYEIGVFQRSVKKLRNDEKKGDIIPFKKHQ